MKSHFILVDDDSVNNMICRRIIKKLLPDADIQTFLEPEEALLYLKNNYAQPGAGHALLLLDINMPTMTAWEFMAAFEKMDTSIIEHIKIYILSSSVDSHDKARAVANKHIIDYIVKPLNKEAMLSIEKSIQMIF